MATVTTEKHVRYSADALDTIAAAWYFVMSHVDEFDAPSITINPMWVYSDSEDGVLHYSATVSGNVND
jgi:hypothetical protein